MGRMENGSSIRNGENGNMDRKEMENKIGIQVEMGESKRD